MKIKTKAEKGIKIGALLIFIGMSLLWTGCGLQGSENKTGSQTESRSGGKPDERSSEKLPVIQTDDEHMKNMETAAPVQTEPAGTEIGQEIEEGINGEMNINVDSADSEISVESQFYITGISDELFARIQGKSYKDDCTLPREDLRYLHVLHKDLEGNVQEGEMIVNVHIAEDVLEILKTLYENDYPIEKIRLVDEYDADDEKSMEDNNSSSFNFRFISHTTKVSKHGMGLAVDINTLYNPYVKTVDGQTVIEPVTARPYLDREADFPYKIEKGDLCYELFLQHGFEWGGDWSDRKDYQHFEIPTAKIGEWYP